MYSREPAYICMLTIVALGWVKTKHGILHFVFYKSLVLDQQPNSLLSSKQHKNLNGLLSVIHRLDACALKYTDKNCIFQIFVSKALLPLQFLLYDTINNEGALRWMQGGVQYSRLIFMYFCLFHVFKLFY